MLQDEFNSGEISLVRDLTRLSYHMQRVGEFFYSEDFQPHLDRQYRSSLPRFDALNWLPVSDTLNPYGERLKFSGAADWLKSKGGRDIAPYAHGNSARVNALRMVDGRIKVLRIGVEDNSFVSSHHERLECPLVLQPDEKIILNDSSADKSLVLEILPCVPVLPNGVACVEIVSGHSAYPKYTHPELLSHQISPDEVSGMERDKLTFAAFLGSHAGAGFEINRVSDIGILPDGTPVFVDPDVLGKGNRDVNISTVRAQNLLYSLGLGGYYNWFGFDGRSKQDVFFPSPNRVTTAKKDYPYLQI